MEKQPQDYRDNLADKLREIRNSDEENPELARAKAQGYLEASENSKEYKDSDVEHKKELLEKNTR